MGLKDESLITNKVLLQEGHFLHNMFVSFLSTLRLFHSQPVILSLHSSSRRALICHTDIILAWNKRECLRLAWTLKCHSYKQNTETCLPQKWARTQSSCHLQVVLCCLSDSKTLILLCRNTHKKDL